MTQKMIKIAGIFVVLVAIATGVWLVKNAYSQGGAESVLRFNTVPEAPRVEHASSFLDQVVYDRYFTAAAASKVEAVDEPVVSGVISHHLVAGVYEARFFDALKEQNPPVVVLIGPNHPQAGRNPIVTSLGTWKTPYGNLNVSQNIVQKLVDQKIAVVDEDVIGAEHTISADVPFIKHAWGDTQLVPLIIKENTSTSTLENLAKTLQEILPKNSVVLASVDFSHYLPESVASFHDELSRNVLAVGDLGRVSKLEVDSPKSLYFLLYYNQLKEAQKFTLLSSTNSGTISENSTTTETTSHIIGYYTAGKPAESPITTVQFFGDIMLDRNVAKAMGDKGLEYLFAKLKGQENRFFYGMDYLIANLEGPFAQARVPTTKTIAFRFDPNLAAQIKNYGFTAVSLANNHTLDMGWANVAFTHETLDKAGIGHFGDELREGPEYTWFSKLPNGTGQIAFIGINTTDHPIDTAKISTAIKDAKAKAQYVMVMMHWGVEYQRISREQERDLAHSFIDQGVSAVIGAHPHVIEESELYKGKPIFYSLGNFVFDQYFSQETQEGLSVGLVLQDGVVKKVYAFPMFGVKSQVQLMNGTRRDDFLNWLNENSRLGEKKFEGGVLDISN